MGQYGGMMPGMGGDKDLLMLAGPYAQQYITPAILVFKNTLDWLSGDTDLLAVSAKILSDPNLVYDDKVKISVDETDEQLQQAGAGAEGGPQGRAAQRRVPAHPRYPGALRGVRPAPLAHAPAGPGQRLARVSGGTNASYNGLVNYEHGHVT